VKVLPSVIMIATLASAVAGCDSSGTTEDSAAAWAERDRIWCERGGSTWRPALGVCESPRGSN